MKRQILIATTALGFMLAGSSHANLVINGGFELGNVPIVNDNRTNFIDGWTTQGDVFTETYQVEFRHSGSYAAQFSQPEGGRGRVAQTLPTTAGLSYELSYWLQSYRGENSTNAPPFPAGIFRVTAGDLVNEYISSAPAPWQRFTFDFTALSDSTLLEFVNFRAAFSLDDVSVVEIAAIPEPGPVAVLGIGVFALLCSRARKGKGA